MHPFSGATLSVNNSRIIFIAGIQPRSALYLLQPALASTTNSEIHSNISSPVATSAPMSGSTAVPLAFSSPTPISSSSIQSLFPRLAPLRPPTHVVTTASATPPNGNDPKPPSTRRTRKRPVRKPSAFEETIDNMTMKRMGRGTIYYGPRPTYDDPTADAAQSAADPDPEGDGDDVDVDDGTLKPDAVLVTGATGRTGQWIALGLLNQDFNVRCLSRSFDAVERIFGPSGANVDVFEGDLTRPSDVEPAVDGALAIVVASGAPLWRLTLPGAAVDAVAAQNLAAAAKRNHPASVSRIVLISSAASQGPRAAGKRAAERLVRECGVPYVIVRVGKLTDEEGGIKRVSMRPVPSAVRGGGEGMAEGQGEEGEDALRPISRLDLAQCVCQALVYDRKVRALRQDDPDGDFEFPNCVMTAENLDEEFVADKRFWTTQFSKISSAFQDAGEPAPSDETGVVAGDVESK